jgi:hypothetical protein
VKVKGSCYTGPLAKVVIVVRATNGRVPQRRTRQTIGLKVKEGGETGACAVQKTEAHPYKECVLGLYTVFL